MLTVTKDTNNISGVRNDISISITTNVDAAGIRYKVRLSFSNANINAAVNGVKIILTWDSGANSFEFNCGSAGGIGFYYPRSSFTNDSQFIDGLAAVIAATDEFAQYFDVYRDGIANAIILEARFVGPMYNLTITGTQPLTSTILVLGKVPVAGYTIYMDVYEEEPYKSNDFKKLIGQQLYPDESKTFDVNLKRILQNPDMNSARILPSIPQDNSLTAEVNNSAVRRYFYKLSEVANAGLAGAGSRITSTIKYTMLAGVNYEAILKGFDLSAFLLQAESPFLTWTPQEKLNAKDQPDFLYFFRTNSTNFVPGAETKLYADMIFENGSVLTGQPVLPIPSFQLFDMLIIPTGYFQLGLQAFVTDPENDIQQYAVYVYHNGQRISVKKSYRVDLHCPEDRQYFIFQNSLGGMDVLYCHGKELANNVKETSVERIMYDDRLNNFENSQYFSSEKIGRRTFNTLTRNVDKEYLAYLAEFFGSNNIFLISSGKYIPVKLTKMSLTLFKQRPDLQNLPIEYQYAFDDNGFTPI